ncbi:hypothetical protein QUA82_21790 [Microcoleus sp. F8-D3]
MLAKKKPGRTKTGRSSRGRPSKWKLYPKTKLIRVPVKFADRLLELALYMDEHDSDLRELDDFLYPKITLRGREPKSRELLKFLDPCQPRVPEPWEEYVEPDVIWDDDVGEWVPC